VNKSMIKKETFSKFRKNQQQRCLHKNRQTPLPGAVPRGEGTGGNSPPLLTKVVFVNRLKPMRKYWGYEGGRHQPYLNFSLS